MIKHIFFIVLSVLLIHPVMGQEEDTAGSYTDSIAYQSVAHIPLLTNAVVRFDHSASVYLSWEGSSEAESYLVKYKPLFTEEWASTMVAANEALIHNLPLDVAFEWTIEAADGQSGDIGSFSSFPQTEPLEVSASLYSNLVDWFVEEEQQIPFCDFMEDLRLHPYEKLSFLQAYAFNNAPFQNEGGSTDGSLTAFFPEGTGDNCIPPPANESNCRCKVITRGGNSALPNDSYDYVRGKILPTEIRGWSTQGTIRSYWTKRKSGAAKFMSISQVEEYGRGDHVISSKSDSGASPQVSEIDFMLGCLTEGRFNTNLPEECACERPLDIKYKYNTQLYVTATKRGCICSRGAAAQAEDMAFVVVQDGKTGDLTTLDAGHAMVGRRCDSSWNPDFWIALLNVVNPIVEYYIGGDSIPSSSQIDDLIQGLQDLIGTPFSNNTGSCGSVDEERTLVNGQAQFLLRPNNPIKASMFSMHYLRTIGYGRWRAKAAIASDYHLVGVVESQLTPDEECCADKFTSYTLGSLSDGGNSRITLNPPFSTQNHMQEVGGFLATYGDWYGLSTIPSTGWIELDREFGLYSGVSCTEAESQLQVTYPPAVAPGYATFDETGLKVTAYPTITKDWLNIRIDSPLAGDLQIRIIDSQGRLVKATDSFAEQGTQTLPISLSSLLPGTYFGQVLQGKRQERFKFIIR